MYELKTKLNDSSIDKFLSQIDDESKRIFSYKIIDLMKNITKKEPKMWGPSIIGFGSYHYKYKSGHEGEMCAVGFSPRKQAMTIYILAGTHEYENLLEKLGKHKKGKGCLYIKKEADIDFKILKKLIFESYKYIINKKWD